MAEAASPSQPGAAPGWYTDPWGQARLRWWDGTRWTHHVSTAFDAWSVGNEQARVRRNEEVGVGRWLRRILVLQPLAFAVVYAVYGSAFRWVVDHANDAKAPDPPSWFQWANLAAPISIALLVLRIVWLLRASETARVLGLPAKRTPGLSAAGWIIPVVNLWWPYQGVRDAFPADDRPGRRLGWWWGSTIASYVAIAVAVAGAWLPPAGQAAAVAVALVPIVIATILERRLVHDVLDTHTRLAG